MTNLTFSYANWTAPPISQVNFTTNCTIVAAWARTWLSDADSVEVSPAVEYFRLALPEELQQRNLTAGQLVDWYLKLAKTFRDDIAAKNQSNTSGLTDFSKYVTVRPFEACVQEVCRAVDWDGVPDITGPGVMISVWIQAVLATVIPLLQVWEKRRERRSITSGRRLQLIFDAFTATLPMFLTSSMILSICISIGAIVILARKEATGASQNALAHDIGMFSVLAIMFPGVVDEAIRGQSGPAFPGVVWVFCVVLYIVMGNMAGILSRQIQYRTNWEEYCFWDIIPNERGITFKLILASSVLVWLYWILLGIEYWILFRWFRSVGVRVRRIRKKWQPCFIILIGIFMWYMLIALTVVRQLLLKRSDYRSEDLTWSFGQILSLGTWLPFCVELYYLFHKGLADTLQGRVPDGWKVIKDTGEGLTATDTVLLEPRRNETEENIPLVPAATSPGRGGNRDTHGSLASLNVSEDDESRLPRSTTI